MHFINISSVLLVTFISLTENNDITNFIFSVHAFKALCYIPHIQNLTSEFPKQLFYWKNISTEFCKFCQKYLLQILKINLGTTIQNIMNNLTFVTKIQQKNDKKNFSKITRLCIRRLFIFYQNVFIWTGIITCLQKTQTARYQYHILPLKTHFLWSGKIWWLLIYFCSHIFQWLLYQLTVMYKWSTFTMQNSVPVTTQSVNTAIFLTFLH